MKAAGILLAFARLAAGPVAFVLLTVPVPGPGALWAAVAIVAAEFLYELARFPVKGDTAATRAVDGAIVSIVRVAVFLAFFAVGWIPAWAFAAMCLPEILVPYLRTFGRQAGWELAPRWSDRTKNLTFAVAQLFVLLPVPAVSLAQRAAFAVGASLAVAYVCVADHVFALGRHARRATP